MRHSKSSLFLMELIIVILFFSLASAVCIRLFAKSHIISRETVEQNHAITQAQNLAEAWYATSGDMGRIQQLLPDAVLSEDAEHLSIDFDADWNAITPGTTAPPSSYRATLTSGYLDERGLLHAGISVQRVLSERSNDDALSSEDRAKAHIYSLGLWQHITDRRETR